MISTRRKGDSPIVAEAMDIMDKANEVTQKMGAELLAEAAAEPNMDRFLDRSPKVGQPIDYEELVRVLHRKREMFITAEAKRKSGIKDEEPTDE